MSICQDALLGNTSKVVSTWAGPHLNTPFQIPDDGTNDPSAMRSVRWDGCNTVNHHAILLYVSVSTALIIAPLSTIAKNCTRSPSGPCNDVTVLNRALVAVCLGVPVSSNAYMSTMVFMLIDSTFSKVWRWSSSTAKSNMPLIVSGTSVCSVTQSPCRSIVATDSRGQSCVVTDDGAVPSMSGLGVGTTAGPLPAVIPPHFPRLQTNPRLHFHTCQCRMHTMCPRCLPHGMSKLAGLVLVQTRIWQVMLGVMLAKHTGPAILVVWVALLFAACLQPAVSNSFPEAAVGLSPGMFH